ncbi:MAG TPA: ABC transporter permease [Bryobacteraceae bacterium]|nr:ABC transporter permease [Bryobacteraceae bacterium]
MRQRLRRIIRKELIQALRDPRMRTMLFLPPLLQLLIFGYAATLDVDNAKIAWMDQDHTPQSRELLSEFEGSGRFLLAGMPENERSMQLMMDRGQVDAVIRVLPGFARDIKRGRTTSVQVLVDGTNSNTASIVSGYATACIQRYANEVGDQGQRDMLVASTEDSGGAVKMAAPQITARTRVWFNPDLRSRNYFIPGVIANIITLVTLSLTAMAIVREKEIGTMEQLMVTPIRPTELILGKTLPFVLVGIWDMLLVTAAGLLVFHIPFHGNFWLLLGSTLLFLLTSLGAGLFISTVSRTQQQAMMATSLFFQPFFMLSGFTFPIRNMPTVAQWLTFLNPVRYFMEIVRGVFLQGSGVEALWPQMLALAIFGVIILSLSVARFHKQLE